MKRTDLISVAAEAAHEVNRIWQRAIKEDVSPVWHDAPDWQKLSAIDGVTRLFELSEFDLATTNPRTNHDRWMSVKLRDGWTFGTVKDAEKKTHPCLLPYDELPLEQQVKDLLFGDVACAFRRLFRSKYCQPQQANPHHHTMVSGTFQDQGGWAGKEVRVHHDGTVIVPHKPDTRVFPDGDGDAD